MYVKGVSQVTNNRKGRSNEHTKRHSVVFYYDESGIFHSKRVSRLEAIYYKTKICRQIKVYCEICQEKFTILVKKNEQLICPKCLS